MHHGINLVFRQKLCDQRIVADVADYKAAGRDRLPKTFDEIVQDDDPFAGLAQLSYDMTANVAGTAGD
jgi:hypothetical protein